MIKIVSVDDLKPNEIDLIQWTQIIPDQSLLMPLGTVLASFCFLLKFPIINSPLPTGNVCQCCLQAEDQ